MNYDTQKLKNYLLGSLSATETEAFDDLSFTDENFDAALNAAENDLIDAYLNNELNGAGLKKFESIYLATKHRREKVEFARAVQIFAEKEIAKTETQTERSGFFTTRNIFGNRAWQFGFAAALLVLFFGIFWFAFLREKKSREEFAMQNSPPPQAAAPENKVVNNEKNPSAIADETNENSENVNEKANRKNSNGNKKTVESNQKSGNENPSPKIENNQPKTIIAAFFLAPPLRGMNKISLFDIPKNASQISVELQLEASGFENYHVTLTNETGDINLWRRGSLKAKNKGDEKFLNVNFPAKLLNNGFYSLTVSGVNASGEAEIIANYPFRVNEK
jgi:hypothetical protein